MSQKVLEGQVPVVRTFFGIAEGKGFVNFFLKYICEKHFGVGYDGVACLLPGDIEPWEGDSPVNGVLFHGNFDDEKAVLDYEPFIRIVDFMIDDYLATYPEDSDLAKKYRLYLNSKFSTKCKAGYQRDL